MTEHSLRVLIVRLGAMGDILHALPAVTALRAAHPDWWIGWAVEPQWRALLSAPGEHPAHTPAMPLVDRIHSIAAKQWGREPLAAATVRGLLASRRELRNAHYEVAVDLQGAVRSAVIARWARAARLIGEAVPREPLARWWFSERVATAGTHVIEQAAEVTRAVAGDALPIALPCLPCDPEAEAWVAAHLPAAPFVLLSPGAGWGAKRWPLERYAQVARALAADGVRVVVNASPAERLLGERIAAESGALPLVPTLGQLIELTRRAALAIAGDTGPLHLAAALGRPTVGIFGPTDPARNGPFHPVQPGARTGTGTGDDPGAYPGVDLGVDLGADLGTAHGPDRSGELGADRGPDLDAQRGRLEACGRHIVLRHPESRRDHTRRREPEAGLLTIAAAEVLAAARQLLGRHQGSSVAEAPPAPLPGLPAEMRG